MANIPPQEKPFTVPDGLACPRCNQIIRNAQSVTPGGGNTFRKGLIIVCSQCAMITMVGDSKLLPMSKADIEKLPPKLQQNLLITCNMIAQQQTKNN